MRNNTTEGARLLEEGGNSCNRRKTSAITIAKRLQKAGFEPSCVVLPDGTQIVLQGSTPAENSPLAEELLQACRSRKNER